MRLLEGGFQTSSANFREVVRSTLSRNPDFVKVGGQWGLRDWYGTHGTRRARRTTAPEDQAQVGQENEESAAETVDIKT